MINNKKKVLESKGYKVGSIEEFLELSTEESDFRSGLRSILLEATTHQLQTLARQSGPWFEFRGERYR
jgi:hypothetical protein